MAVGWVKVGLEAHDEHGRGGDVLVYQGPDGDVATAALAACLTIGVAFAKVGTFRDERHYKVAIPMPA